MEEMASRFSFSDADWTITSPIVTNAARRGNGFTACKRGLLTGLLRNQIKQSNMI
jgi:hypothetical protein